jgi:hypothetical protein
MQATLSVDLDSDRCASGVAWYDQSMSQGAEHAADHYS